MKTTDPVVQTLQLALDTVPAARRLVRDCLAGTEVEELATDVEIVVSELATNAVLHGRPPAWLRLTAGDGAVLVETFDGNPVAPVMAMLSEDAMTGRGLALVTAMSTRWGVEPTAEGKRVWAELTPRSVAAAEAPGLMSDADIDAMLADWPDDAQLVDDRIVVTLEDVPTRLLLDAKRHVDSLVREFALASGGAASGASAHLPQRLAELIADTQSTVWFTDVRQAIKRQAAAAAAAGKERTQLTLALAPNTSDAGERYLATLDEIDTYARAARLLTIATPPQHRAFRRWYVTSLVTQLRAEVAGQPRPRTPTFEEYLLDTLQVVTDAQQSAERSARLQSATSALAQPVTPGEVATVIARESAEALGAYGGAVVVTSAEGHLDVAGSHGYPAGFLRRLRTQRLGTTLPAAQVLQTGQPIWIETPESRQQYPDLAEFEPESVAVCAVPLSAGGRMLAALRLSFDHSRLFDADDRQFVEALAAQAATALDRAQLREREHRVVERTTFLSHATQRLTSSLDQADTLRNLTSLLVPGLADWVVVYLMEDDGSVRPMTFTHRDPALSAAFGPVFASSRVKIDPAGPFGMALASGRPSRFDRIPPHLRERLMRHVPDMGLAAKVDPKSGIVASLSIRGQVVGAVGLARTSDRRFTDEEIDLIEDLAARAAVAVVNARQFARQRETALTLQHSLLPQQIPDVPGVPLAWRYLAAGEGALIGGDWYDVLPMDDGRLTLIIGDVMGRGIQAAAVMGQLRATARAYAVANLPPSAVLTRLDAAVIRLEQEQITTAAIAVLDPVAATLTVASAGHLPPLVIPPDGPSFFASVHPGPPLGVGQPHYDEAVVSMAPGTTVLLYTDGLVETRERTVEDGMEALRTSVSGPISPEQTCERVLEVMQGAGTHDDDRALLAVSLLAQH
ncbi:MAG TPA: SpoIIE family protein phosphatase [Mycobacteriales bacterium]|nr:SpoIIE family protein phosphatase [Mycobacteriales bacterium]